MAEGRVVEVAETSVAWGEGVGAQVGGFWDDVQGGGVAPVEAEEADTEVPCCFDDTVGVAGPEVGFLAVVGRGKEVLVSGAELDSCREGFEGAGEGTGRGELLEMFVGVLTRFSECPRSWIGPGDLPFVKYSQSLTNSRSPLNVEFAPLMRFKTSSIPEATCQLVNLAANTVASKGRVTHDFQHSS